MPEVEYFEQTDPSRSWECFKCLFPNLDLSESYDEQSDGNDNVDNGSGKEGGQNIRLPIKGIKFAHVNIATPLGHAIDINVLLERKLFTYSMFLVHVKID